MDDLEFVMLSGDYKSTFWRYHMNGGSCVCSLEAVFYFFREFGRILGKGVLDGLENILFFYVLLFRKIQEAYEMKRIKVNRKKNLEYFKEFDN